MAAHITPGIYRHYKGNEYQVFGLAIHSETLEQLVMYRALYGDFGMWVRPLVMFSESVTVNGEEIQRFTLVKKIDDAELASSH